jgi:hypothetical protein
LKEQSVVRSLGKAIFELGRRSLGIGVQLCRVFVNRTEDKEGTRLFHNFTILKYKPFHFMFAENSRGKKFLSTNQKLTDTTTDGLTDLFCLKHSEYVEIDRLTVVTVFLERH